MDTSQAFSPPLVPASQKKEHLTSQPVMQPNILLLINTASLPIIQVPYQYNPIVNSTNLLPIQVLYQLIQPSCQYGLVPTFCANKPKHYALITALTEQFIKGGDTTKLKQIAEVGLKTSQGEELTIDSIIAVAQHGDANTQYFLGRVYLRKKNYPRAQYWLLLACKQKHSQACNAMGNLYRDGRVVNRNYFLAFCCFSLAIQADPKNHYALYNLGDMYLEGLGTKQNSKLAIKCYIQSANQGNAGAQNALGIIYAQGNVAPKDLDLAEKYFGFAANQGDVVAQKNLRLLNIKKNHSRQRCIRYQIKKMYSPIKNSLGNINKGRKAIRKLKRIMDMDTSISRYTPPEKKRKIESNNINSLTTQALKIKIEYQMNEDIDLSYVTKRASEIKRNHRPIQSITKTT